MHIYTQCGQPGIQAESGTVSMLGKGDIGYHVCLGDFLAIIPIG